MGDVVASVGIFFSKKGKSELSKRKCALIAALFALLFVIMLPLRPEYGVSGGVRITATGERNPDSKGAEVWLSSSMLDAGGAGVRLDNGWERRGDSLVSYQRQPATILVNSGLRPDGALVFVKHEYSGILEIAGEDFVRRYDLYSAEPGNLYLDLRNLLPFKLNPWRTVWHGFLVYVAAFVAFFLATVVVLSRGLANDGKMNHAKAEKVGWNIWLATPSIIIFGVSLATYWPAQMSPDSIEQWRQIVGGHYADAHPVLSTALYKLAYIVYPAPQSAVIFQLLAFSLVTWFFLREMLAWGVPRYIAAVAAVVVPLFPATFMLVSTLWKDVPFAVGIILLSALAAREVRMGLELRWRSLIAMGAAGLLIFGVRHNGIVIVALFFSTLAVFAPERHGKIRAVLMLFTQIAIFIFIKTLLLNIIGAQPVPPQYRSIFALHVLGAMENADVQFDPVDQKLVEKVLPRQEWLDGYDCKSAVALFWNRHISYEFLADNATSLNRLMFKEIARHPAVFLRHQLCVTGLIWRISGEPGEFTVISPGEITKMQESTDLGLVSHSLLPEVKSKVDILYSQISSIYTRPALYMLIGLWAMLMVMCRSSFTAFIVFSPALFNCVGLSVLMGAQDYRYLWPSVVLSLLMFFLAVGMAMSGRRPGMAFIQAK